MIISVIMPVYNAAPYVGEAIRSALAQTLGDFEFIIIDDASTDGSREVLASFTDPRCRVLANATNLGAAETKNRGLAEARGEFVAFLDADDVAVPQRFARQVEWLRAHPNVGLVGSSIEHIDGAGNSLGFFDLSEPDPGALRARLCTQNRIAQSSVMLRASALGMLRFRKEFEPAEDYDLWVRLASQSELVVLGDVLVRYRIHDQSVSARKNAAMLRAIAAIQGRGAQACAPRAPFLKKAVHRLRRLLVRFGFVAAPTPKEELADTIERYRRAGICIGENCYIHGALLPDGDPIEIGDDCVLTYCTILGHDASPALFLPELRGTGLFDRVSLRRRTVIHDQCFIGAQAIVLCGVEIGPRSIVGAGAVVTQDVPPGVVVAGNPARVVGTVEEFIAKHRAAIRANPEYYPGVDRQ
ncbi:MAG: glycosyltransferase [Chthoniobacter sp.]|uniref:glycosyltransferase n=1 Tax=Chthoniobacter sp. TaxID=2510640 RepID=UPI0032A40662